MLHPESRTTMPMYEYRCQGCGKSFELLRRMQDSDRDLKCPECQSDEVERLLSTFAAGGCKPSGSGRFT
jgi:putative FmdB family regulatory protein